MSGGKGGSTTSSITIPEYIEAAAQRNLNKAERISQIGYTPYYGPDVAAFTPMQQAGFQNTADLAGAFGMAGGDMSQQDIMGGMGPATTYAGGVQGYSSAPIYEQSLQTLGEKRPGQKAYIDSFFIDPYTGAAGTNNFAPIDYTTYGTVADQVAAQQANDLAIAQAGNYELTDQAVDPALAAQPDPTIFESTPSNIQNSQEILATDPSNPNYNSAFQDVYDYQSDQAEIDPYGQSTGFGITPDVVDAAGGIEAFLPEEFGPYLPTDIPEDFSVIDPNQQASSVITSPAEGITDTSTAGTGIQILNDLTELGTGLASNTLAGSILLGPSYDVGGVNNPIETPTVEEMIQNAPPGMTYNPSTGSYVTTPVESNDDNNNTAHDDMMATATSTAPVTSIRPVLRGDADSGADTGDDGGCVVATHAVSSGAFSPKTKREAVVWCMNVLHGKWWGEAIRRGYRHLGRSKIEQGRAAEHYQEFRDYIAFATGKKRTVKGAIHFAARTVQFLAVGLVKKDA